MKGMLQAGLQLHTETQACLTCSHCMHAFDKRYAGAQNRHLVHHIIIGMQTFVVGTNAMSRLDSNNSVWSKYNINDEGHEHLHLSVACLWQCACRD